MKTVYSYDYEGKFIGTTEAELCQVTELKKMSDSSIESVYIIPGHSTEVTPPPYNASTEFISFDGDVWSIHEIVKEEKVTEPEIILTYKQLRAGEYPSFLEYLDGIIKGDTTQIQKYIDDCLAVKAKYPKV
jgi:histidinol phosphatase-like PHP family hydrolase